MTYFTPFLIRLILLYIIVPAFYFSQYARKLQWAYSDGGHLIRQAFGIEPGAGAIIHFTTMGKINSVWLI